MKNMVDYLSERYFKCDVSEKEYYFNLYLKAYFKQKSYI